MVTWLTKPGICIFNFAAKIYDMKKLFGCIICLGMINMAISQEAPEGLFIASKAPDFKAKDQLGNEVKLKDLLKKGKVVLLFYRGYWCPYCNRELSRLNDSLHLIAEKGATVVAVTPEKPDYIDSTLSKTKARFSILYDEGMKIMKAYDVEFEVQENVLTRYRNAGIDIEKNNGSNGKYLPVPAVYIIDKESTVTYRFFNQDYRKRPTVKELLDNL
jgi:peroxiredoxin